MHEVFRTPDGWAQEILRDDSDSVGNLQSPEKKPDELAGVAFIEYKRETPDYKATIRFEEHKHNAYVSVEAIVYKNSNGKGHDGNGHDDNGRSHHTLSDALFWETKDFNGDDCKRDAARFARGLQQKIEYLYFPAGQQPS